jgi:uncharacterized membrane protein YeaQ/YmgE (transglycosylase-associated protein family)
MGWIITIIVGGIIGWLASKIMKTDEQQGILANIVIGVIGALLGRWVFADLLGIGGATAAGEFSLAGLLWGIIGAVILIAILKALNVLR